jgi:UDP-glucose 4-epimerase
MKWLVTGASGFVGRAMVARLARDAGNEVCAAVRRPGGPLAGGVPCTVVPELGPGTDWQAHLAGVDVVVHLAARVHAKDDARGDALAESRRVNVQGTQNLARQAALAGVRRLVFVSSVKVHGESTLPGAPFRADDAPHPQGAYGVSKHEAEDALYALASSTRMEVVVVRPPLVYGPGVQANFRALMHAVARGLPLPLGAVHNQRSFVALDNLVDLIAVCAQHPAAANQSFLVSDGCDLSTTELLRRMGHALGRPARLWPVPMPVLQGLMRLAGRGAALQRLCGNLQVDITKTRDLLGWAPPIPVDEGMRRAAADYLEGLKGRA